MPPLTTIGIMVAVALVIAITQNLTTAPQANNKPAEVLSVSPTPVPTITPELTLAPTPTPKPLPTQETAHPTPLPNPTTAPSASSWLYPGSTSNSSGEYTTNDDPATVTNWYKEAFGRQHFNTKSFIQTNSNDNVNNSLVVANENSQVHVTIQRIAGQNVTKITVKY